ESGLAVRDARNECLVLVRSGLAKRGGLHPRDAELGVFTLQATLNSLQDLGSGADKVDSDVRTLGCGTKSRKEIHPSHTILSWGAAAANKPQKGHAVWRDDIGFTENRCKGVVPTCFHEHVSIGRADHAAALPVPCPLSEK